MSFLLVDILDLYNGLGYGYNRYEFMTLEGFLYMCGFLLALLLINRILGNKKIENSVFKDQDLSNYTLGFTNSEEDLSLTINEAKVSNFKRAIIYFIVIILIFFPISYFIQTLNPNFLWF